MTAQESAKDRIRSLKIELQIAQGQRGELDGKIEVISKQIESLTPMAADPEPAAQTAPAAQPESAPAK